MGEKEFRRSLSVFPIGTIMMLTDLSARQIRYYEEQNLIHPKRSDTNRRLFSLNDIDRLLEIKEYLQDGLNIAAIQKIYQKNPAKVATEKGLTDDDVRRIFYKEIMNISGFSGDRSERLF